MSAVFDYERLAAGLGVSDERLRELESCIRQQYGRDEMLVELRMLRTLRALQAGSVALEQAIAEFQESPAEQPAGATAEQRA